MERTERLQGALERAAQLNLRLAQMVDSVEELGLDPDRCLERALTMQRITRELNEELLLARAVGDR